MTLITLADLRPQLHSLAPRRRAQMQKSDLQQRLDLVLQQAQLGLDITPLVTSDPKLEGLVMKLKALMPSLFQPQPNLRLAVDLSAPLLVPDKEAVMVQATVNLGVRRGIPKLFDWALRYPQFNWKDAVQLWVTAEFYQDQGIVPSQLKLVVVALHPTRSATPIVFEWNRRLHKQTEAWLQKRVQGEAELELPAIQPTRQDDLESELAVIDVKAYLDQFPEVVI